MSEPGAPRGHIPEMPRPAEAEAAPAIPLALRYPPATCGLIAAFVLVFGLELAHSTLLLPELGAPSLQTLVLLGGGVRELILVAGEYFRLLTLGFLHGGFLHLIMNSLCLFALGRRLEFWIGPRWFLALFFLGTTGASLVSMLWNGPEVVAIGASGGVMAIAGFLGIASLRLPPGAFRKDNLDLVRNLVGVTLAIGFFAALLVPIDNAAHIGGLATGALLAFVLVPVWRDVRDEPGARMVAMLGVIAGFATLGYGAMVLAGHH